MAIFESGMAELARVFKASAAIDIIYHRGVDSAVLIGKAWVGRTKFRVSDTQGSRLIYSDRDFLIKCDDLRVNALLIEPQLGDWIEQVFTNVEGNQIFELMNPDNEPAWRYSDPQRTIYRIHTKRVVR